MKLRRVNWYTPGFVGRGFNYSLESDYWRGEGVGDLTDKRWCGDGFLLCVFSPGDTASPYRRKAWHSFIRLYNLGYGPSRVIRVESPEDGDRIMSDLFGC